MKQRTARQWRMTLNRVSGKSTRQDIVFNLEPKLARNATLEGRKYLVVPMVMLTEGVHRGSNGRLLYPAEELAKTPVVWNMKPIVVDHPEENGVGLSACDADVAEVYKVGMIMNTRFEEDASPVPRLCAEAWIEESRANKVDKRVMTAVHNGTMLELSTGVFVDKEGEPGEHNGEDYDAIARNYRPDHLAILPDKKGACSIEDGAGFIRNAEQNPKILEQLLDYTSDAPTANKADPMAEEASRAAVKSGAWAVIRGTKKSHEEATAAHEKASRLHAKAKNKEFSQWHAQKAADHTSWCDECEDPKKVTKNKNDIPDPTDEAPEGDDQDETMYTSDAASAAAVDRSNNAMTRRTAMAHKSAAIAHRVASSRHRSENDDVDTLVSKYHAGAAKLHDAMCKACVTNGKDDISFDNIRQTLSEELRADDPQGCTCWVMDVYEDYFVYSDGKGKLFKQDYSVTKGTVKIEGEPTAVVRVTSYEPARNVQTNNETMNKKKMINALITNFGWEEDDRDFLNGKSDERIESLYKSAKAEAATKNSRTAKDHATVDDSDEDPDAADNQDDSRTATKKVTGKRGVGEIISKNEEEDDEDDKPAKKTKAAPDKKLSMNAYLETLPAEVQEVIQNAQEINNRERRKLTEAIVANEANEFSDKELAAMPLKTLQRLAKLARNAATENEEQSGDRAPIFVGQGDAAPVENAGVEFDSDEDDEDRHTRNARKANSGDKGTRGGEVLEMPVMNFDKEKSA